MQTVTPRCIGLLFELKIGHENEIGHNDTETQHDDAALYGSHAACLIVVICIRLSTQLDMLTMAAIGVMRYIAITCPTSSVRLLTWRRCTAGVLIIWTYATVWVCVLFTPSVARYSYSPRLFMCLVDGVQTSYGVANTVCVYVISVIVLAVTYTRIYLTVRRTRLKVNQSTCGSSSRPASTSAPLAAMVRTNNTRRIADETRLAFQLIIIVGVFVL